MNVLHFSRRYAAILLWLVLFFAVPAALAHPYSQKLSDPDGRTRAAKLMEAYGNAHENAKDQAFMTLFLLDPNLSKRAFVALLDQGLDQAASNPKAAEKTLGFASALANLIAVQYGDPKPNQLIEMLVREDAQTPAAALAYLDSLKAVAAKQPKTGEATQAADAAKMEKLAEMVTPLLIKAMRIEYATIMAHPDLIISELDTYQIVVDQLRGSVAALGMDPGSLAELWDKKSQKEFLLRKLVVMAEIGLLDDFEKGTRQLLAGPPAVDNEAAVLLTGFRAAARQNRLDLAGDYLGQARALRSAPGAKADPVLEYALRTAEYQLRVMQGLKPTQAITMAEFSKAWAALDSYKPLAEDQDTNWYYARLATHYWMDQMVNYDTAGRKVALQVLVRIGDWMKPLDNFKVDNSSIDGMVRVFAACTLVVAAVDQLTYVFECYPELLTSADSVRGLEDLVTAFVEPQEALKVIKGPGFPPFDVRTGGLNPELLARCRYLESMAPGGKPEQQVALLDQSIGLIRTTKNPESTVEYLIKVGTRLAKIGQQDRAIAAWKEALTLADRLSFVQRSLDASALLAEEYGRRGDWTNASLYADRAGDKIQQTAPLLGLRSPEGQEMAAKGQQLMALSVKAAVEADDPERALAALTRGQQVASATLQMEGRKDAQADAREVFQKEEQVVALAQEVTRLEQMPSSTTRNSLLRSTQEVMADTKARFLAESRNLRQKYSALYNQVLRFDPLNLPDIQRTLPTDMAVVQFFPTDDALYIFLVTRENFRLHKVATTRTALEDSTRSFTKAIRRAVPNDPVVKAESRKLYDSLIGPVEADIAACNTVVLIPSGRLNSLPFAALTGASDEPLGKTKCLLELAKPTDLMRIPEDKPKPIESVVTFANATGDLPAAGREGEEINALFPSPKSHLFEGKTATKDAFVKFGGQAEALHLATHGVWNVEDSLDNYLSMADKQTVAQDEIFQLSLEGTSIVILSACNTAMGDSGDVKYVASLAEAFWIAGSRSVVASLWAVNDESTSILMTELYKSLRSGDGKAEALRKAQMAVRANPKFDHPYYWSGFILFGDWR